LRALSALRGRGTVGGTVGGTAGAGIERAILAGMAKLFDTDALAAVPAAATEDAAPLAARVRPRRLQDFAGQRHLLAEGSALRGALERGEPHSMILHGPPGSGKTTLARMFAASPGFAFEERSAVQVGLAEVRAVIAQARARLSSGDGGRGTVFFLDEIHRFNKAQQDALLPAVEEGLVILIGATTENPAFEIVGALRSRMRIYALEALTDADIEALLRRAISLGEVQPARADDDAVGLLAAGVEGDARAALGALELAGTAASAAGCETITLGHAAEALQRRTILYDRAGDRHYDYISAWIKATRGSDPDASLYYLAVMLEGGEDPRFIVRRMVILASEDVGNADPAALGVAVAAASAVEHVGMPEARYALAQAAIYLSLAPKSNAAGSALAGALAHVREHGAAPVPPWLVSGPRPGKPSAAGVGERYDYPHDHPGHVCAQELMPGELAGARFFVPRESEAQLAERLALIRRARGRE
jgi:putative ATPase